MTTASAYGCEHIGNFCRCCGMTKYWSPSLDRRISMFIPPCETAECVENHSRNCPNRGRIVKCADAA